MLLVALVSIQLPLVNYLGFEFSVVIALLTPWIAGILTIKNLRAPVPGNSGSSGSVFFRQTIGRTLVQCLGILVIPFLVATVNALFVRNCSYLEGACYFLLLPVITAWWSVAFASFCTVAVRRAGLVYALCIVVILLYPVYLGYFSVQIYSYNIIYGFFPGFSYDEALSITPTLVLFRVITLIAGLVFFLLADVMAGRRSDAERISGEIVKPVFRGRGVALALCLMFVIGSWFFRCELGFETSTAQIRKELGALYTTEHFRISYSPASFSDEEIEWVGLQHEFRFDQVQHALQVPAGEPISSYIYPDADVKQKIIGTSTTNIAKPWRREIHLDKDSWQQTIKHELAHVMAGDFGMPVIHAHYNIGLVEGLATAIDGETGNRTLHEYAAAVKVFGLVPEPARLIHPVGFALRASTVSYTLIL